MNSDTIIDEVRAIRDAIAREHNYDLDAIFRMLREHEVASGGRHVTFPPRRPLEGEGSKLEDAVREADAPDGSSRHG